MNTPCSAPSKVDPLVRLILWNCLFGVVVGTVCASLLLAFDFDGLRSLIWRSDITARALALLFGGFAEMFAGMVCVTAIMLVPLEIESE